MQLVIVILLILLPGFLSDFWNKYGPDPNANHHQIRPSHPEPHRDPKTGKIVIENCKLYYEDLKKYGAVQTKKWAREGKYNLTPEERKIELE